MAIHYALAIALFETIALATLLRIWADRVDGARLLVLFLIGVSVWIVGNELPNWFGSGAQALALTLLATAGLTSAVFLHFCATFCGVALRRWQLGLAYGTGAAAMLLSFVVTPGHFEPFAGVAFVAIPNWAGWTTSLIWAALAAAGILVLLRTLLRDRQQDVRQVAAVTLSCGWGLLCMSGYGFAALRLPFYPWPLLGLPLYPIILVYGILRYRVFVANAWARRALAWTILLGLGLAVVGVTLLLPVKSQWISGVAVAAACLALNGPVRRIAERVVYPGGTVTAADLAQWRSDLEAGDSLQELSTTAAALLSRRIGLEVAIAIGVAQDTATGMPEIVLVRSAGAWTTRLQGWESAPPAPRHVAELFGVVLAEAALRVEQAKRLAQREREIQLQARLAELGSIAATVAHDLRNPLNIIAMAVATAGVETRREVADQVARIARLAEDLLDYAKPWQMAPSPIDLASRVREAVRRTREVELGAGLDRPARIVADPARIDQALANLLANAHAAAGDRRVGIDIESTADVLRLHVCDEGPGVPDELRDKLFEPFASRSPGGTGLGLAIVSRIMSAHGGAAELTDRPPWKTCFTLTFPLHHEPVA